VLLHDGANTAFGFAAGMRDLSFLLPAALRERMLNEGSASASAIGPSWADIAAFAAGADARLEAACAAAFAHAASRGAEAARS
jgi:hypothetical protein